MQHTRESFDWWRLPAFALWVVFFGMGFVPEQVYHGLREAGMVVTQRALVNSPHVLTLALSAFLGWFTALRAAEAGCDAMLSRGKGLQMFCVGLIAFSNLPMHVLLQLGDIPIAFYRNLLLAVAAIKMAAWVYALHQLVRYYFFSGPAVYRGMISWFPSTRHLGEAPPPPLNPPG